MSKKGRTYDLEDRKEGRTYDLEDRLIAFGIRIIRLAEALPKTRAGNHIGGQIIRSNIFSA